MTREEAIVGAKIRHANWPAHVYGIIKRFDDDCIVLLVPFAPEDPRQSYFNHLLVTSLPNWSLFVAAPPD